MGRVAGTINVRIAFRESDNGAHGAPCGARLTDVDGVRGVRGRPRSRANRHRLRSPSVVAGRLYHERGTPPILLFIIAVVAVHTHTHTQACSSFCLTDDDDDVIFARRAGKANSIFPVIEHTVLLLLLL